MKTNILIGIFLCLSLVSKGQQDVFSSEIIKKYHVKSVLVKFYSNKVKGANYMAYDYQDYFDKFGNLIKHVQFVGNQKKAIETLYSYTFEDKKVIRESISTNKKGEFNCKK